MISGESKNETLLFCLNLRQGRNIGLSDSSSSSDASVRRRFGNNAFAFRLQLVDKGVDVFRFAAQFHRLRIDHRFTAREEKQLKLEIKNNEVVG